MRTYFSIIIVSIVVLIGCSEEKKSDNDVSELRLKNYSIVVVKENETDSLMKSAKEIKSVFDITSVLNQKRDSLYIGDFKSEIYAWYFAQLFVSDSIIQNYEIAFNRKVIESDVNRMLFVSGYLNRPSLFELNFTDKKTKMVWSQWGRKIIRMYPTVDMKKYYLTTGLTMGRSGGFPFITEARLYQYSKKENEVKRINILGEGTQYSAGWISPDTFKTSFITVDSFKTSKMIDLEIFYNQNGDALDTMETIYDILKDGYPRETIDTLLVNSNSGTYHIQARSEADKFVVSVFKDMSEFIGIVDTTSGSIQKIVWSEDENYVAITAGKFKKNSLEGKFNIYVYSLKEKRVLTTIKNQLLQDIVFYGPYLLSDDLVHNKQIIKIYDCYKNEMFTKITLPMDSGIYSIPIKMSRIKSENLF